MIYRLVVPETLEDVTSVRVLEWHGSAGETVAAGALIVELETHKALIEVRAEQPGVLRRIDCAEGVWVPLGGALALLSDSADEPLAGEGVALPAEFRIG